VWINLLTNALKFSANRERAVIEVGGRQDDGETIYSVHDNGVGFDPQYADKLFGVFQRLHSQREFEGHRGRPGYRPADHSPSRRAGLGGRRTGPRCYLLLYSSSERRLAMTYLDPVDILLVEDNPHEAELIIRALKKHNLANNLFAVKDGAEAWISSSARVNMPNDRWSISPRWCYLI